MVVSWNSDSYFKLKRVLEPISPPPFFFFLHLIGGVFFFFLVLVQKQNKTEDSCFWQPSPPNHPSRAKASTQGFLVPLHAAGDPFDDRKMKSEHSLVSSCLAVKSQCPALSFNFLKMKKKNYLTAPDLS